MRKLMIILFLAVMITGCVSQVQTQPTTVPTDDSKPAKEDIIVAGDNNIYGDIHDSEIKFSGVIKIEGMDNMDFRSEEVSTVRPDIFKEGRFSVFDILVHLKERGDLEMEYHYDESMNTNVIDSINGEENWWYMVYYDGGWPENNNFRIDHYPYKDKMYIRILKEDKEMLDEIYEMFREEIARKNANNGKVIIPKVLLKGPKTNLVFENVEVRAHNLRNDVFQDGMITAVDTIMSLGDDKRITYDLQWYDSIGSAEIVRSYWVNRINDDKAYRSCGFVYEAGSEKYGGFKGNHIHLPSDTRIINSPEYVEYFWICL